jgi:asparagine synthase (glutamine-hydrolysing)
VNVAGDDTGATRKLVLLTRDRCEVFTDWASLMASVGEPLQVSPAGCQFLLAYGLVPPPFTLYSNVYALGIGDRLHAAGSAAELSVDFPYFSSMSSARERPDPQELERRLVAAVERALAGRDAILMQSAGKDSAALLIGLAGVRDKRVKSVTYRPHYREDEAPYAAELAGRFGVPHVVVDADPVREAELLLELCGRAPVICADVAIAGYLRALDGCGAKASVVLDGLGGDIYMGYVQPREEAVLSLLSLPRVRSELWGRIEPARLGAVASYALKSALMYPAERCLSGSHLSPRAVRELIPTPHGSPFDWFFAKLDRRVAPMRPLDRRAYVRGRIYDGAGTMEKARLSAGSIGAQAAFPLCDRELIAHYFHLPPEAKYDERRRITKLPLRALLDAKIGTSRFFAEKGSFRYDVLSFAKHNAKTIEAEIRAAGSVLHDVERWLSFLLARIDNYVHAYSLFALFMLAAWLNRRPEGALVQFGDRGSRRDETAVRIQL